MLNSKFFKANDKKGEREKYARNKNRTKKMTKNTMRKRMLGSKIRRVQEVQAHKMRERERERGYLP